ncbi:MAG: hypothetical protein KGN34_17930 [Sphingomonadales bacterium]|nr:hypothetical protein [Sphingomonadales bacterium]
MPNPLATPAQIAIEDRALRLLARPDLQRVRGIVTMLWQQVAGWPNRDQADRFANMIDEYMFHHAFRAANGDANHPEVARFMAPQHHWFGRDVPGSRWGGDSPDFIYRTVPIAHGGQYVIEGRATCARHPTVNWSLMADNTASPVTQSLLDSLDMDIAADGAFTLTIDSSPAEGRRNHIQTKPGADFLMIRDALGDWQTQSANALAVTRLNPDADPATDDALAAKAARIALDNVYYTYYCTQSGAGQPPNQIRPPMSSAAFGGMPTQSGTKGNIELADNRALIVRGNAAGATFRNLTLTDCYHMSIAYWARTSTLNMDQMRADADGDFTYVIAHRDPGVHNWLDTGGLRRCIFGQRWQAFRRDAENPEPWLTVREVAFDDLPRELPEGVAMIDSDGRAAQLAARAAGFARRFEER